MALCLIRDVAYEGGGSLSAHPGNIPNEIDLYIPRRKWIAHASVRWRHGDKLGLAFSEVARHAADHTPRSRATLAWRGR